MACEICREAEALFGGRYCLWCLVGDQALRCAVVYCEANGMEPLYLRKSPKVRVGRRAALCAEHHGEMHQLGIFPVPAFLAHKAREHALEELA